MIHPFQPLASCITHTLPDHDGQHLLTIAFTSSIDCSAAMSVDMNDMAAELYIDEVNAMVSNYCPS